MWHTEYLDDVKRSTASSYAQHIKNHLKPALGAVKLRALTGPQIQKLYNSLSRAGRNPKTVRKLHGVLHRALSQAVKLGFLRANPCDACTLPSVVNKPMKPLDSPDMTAFLKEIEGHKLEALFKVDIFTGMRRGEMIGLQWSCVDFDRIIDKQLQCERKKGGKWYFGTLKNDKVRTITPAPFVMQALKDQKRKQTEDRLRVGTLWDEGEFPGLVFTTETGAHLDGTTVWRHFKKMVSNIGEPETRFHDLRHTYAVSSLRAGDAVKTVQENLGHHTASFTLDQYGHVTETMKQASAARMVQGIKTARKR